MSRKSRTASYLAMRHTYTAHTHTRLTDLGHCQYQEQGHALDEEFCGRRSNHLEQFTNHPVICNSLSPLDICLTFEGSLVRLTDGTSQNYLWHALQIHSSLLSSSELGSSQHTAQFKLAVSSNYVVYFLYLLNTV